MDYLNQGYSETEAYFTLSYCILFIKGFRQLKHIIIIIIGSSSSSSSSMLCWSFE